MTKPDRETHFDKLGGKTMDELRKEHIDFNQGKEKYFRDGVEYCHCGRQLHYIHKPIQRKTETLIQSLGYFIKVTNYMGFSYLVPRHYIALHGLKAYELKHLGFKKIDHQKIEFNK